MVRLNRVTSYEIKNVLCEIYNIIGYNDFTILDIKEKIKTDSRRLPSILFKASYCGLCMTVGTKRHKYIYNKTFMYRQINKYRLVVSKFYER